MTDTHSITGEHGVAIRPPKYANDRGEASWEDDWGLVAVAPVDLDDPDSPLTVTVDVAPEIECDDGMPPEMGRRLAAAILAACDAAEGRPLGWTQYRAESPPVGEPDPDHDGMVQVGPGQWQGVSQLAETSDADLASVARFYEEHRAAGRDVTVYKRTFATLRDITAWEPTVFVAIDEYANLQRSLRDHRDIPAPELSPREAAR